MVIDQIDIGGMAIEKMNNDSPSAGNRHRPETRQVALVGLFVQQLQSPVTDVIS